MNGAINQAQLAADRRYRMEDILPFGAVERRRGRRAHETLTFGVGVPPVTLLTNPAQPQHSLNTQMPPKLIGSTCAMPNGS